MTHRAAVAAALASAGAAAAAFASYTRAGELALLERPWDASALAWVAIAAIAAVALLPRLPLLAAVVWLAAAGAIALVARLEAIALTAAAAACLFVVAAVSALAGPVRAAPRRTFSVVAAAVVAIAVLGLIGSRIHHAYLGPTHPSSSLRALPVDLVEWAWAGAVTADAFTVTARIAANALAAGQPELIVRTAADGRVVARVPASSVSPARIARFEVSGLQAAARYRWTIAVGGREDHARTGSLQTFPLGPASFAIAFGACAGTGSNGQVFDRIREASPLLFIHTGDFHYEDIDDPAPGAIREAYSRSLRAPAQQALWLNTPVAYTWDDHDYGGNDSDRTTRSREAARSVYRELVPHYPLPLDGPIAQSFDIGRVRVILTDTRSERDPSSRPDGPEKSMLGERQLAWLFDQLLAARDSAALVIWVNSVPWISSESSSDNWGAYTAERRRVAEFIAEHDIRNLIMLSGDAHMLAADDGTNNRYTADAAGPGFPVYHAAALDRRGSVKGGPYSEGAYPGGGQFGLLEIDDRGNQIHVTFSGRNWRGDELVRHEVTFPVALP
ncbi:MAG: hypothetical protein KatS3mg062_0468 [Tepidiforma sp.]|nr:MAG: hypothetical protein KatS3mg062_0468 [Tepidiforma sp.]